MFHIGWCHVQQLTRVNVTTPDDPLALIGERKLRADKAFMAIAEYITQAIRFDVHRSVQVINTTRGLCELGVVVLSESGQERVCDLHVRDAREPGFFDQTVLQRTVGTFNTSLGLAAICAKNLDV